MWQLRVAYPNETIFPSPVRDGTLLPMGYLGGAGRLPTVSRQPKGRRHLDHPPPPDDPGVFKKASPGTANQVPATASGYPATGYTADANAGSYPGPTPTLDASNAGTSDQAPKLRDHPSAPTRYPSRTASIGHRQPDPPHERPP